MFDSIKGRSALVTGGSKGIGKGIAQCLAGAGARVAVVSRHLEEGEQAAKDIGKGARAVAGDVTDLASMEKAVKAAAEAQGGLDILCANAGMFPQAKIEEMTPEQWDEVVNTNLKGAYLSVKAALPYLKKSDQGRVVLTSSITGPVTGFPGWSHYGATKSGQLGFMRTAAIELARYGITVNAVLPGNIITEGLAALGEEYHRTMAASIPLKKLGSVADVGNAVVFFASKEAGFITGQSIIVDGGQILPESLEALAMG
jgi:3-oxoacyl-[acyl-carrier protein] reductase